MQSEEMIPASEFCVHHHIEVSFLHALKESGLIEIITIEETLYLPVNQLCTIEKLVRLYYDFDINLHGIETITCLLQQINDMQQHITQLTHQLYLKESEL